MWGWGSHRIAPRPTFGSHRWVVPSCVAWLSMSLNCIKSDQIKSMELSCHDNSRSVEQELPLTQKSRKRSFWLLPGQVREPANCVAAPWWCEFRLGEAPNTKRLWAGRGVSELSQKFLSSTLTAQSVKFKSQDTVTNEHTQGHYTA